MSKNKNNFVWRVDIKKFFDNVDHNILRVLLTFKIKEDKVFKIFENIIDSYNVNISKDSIGDKRGVPIGNLTSQIFANIYFNEFDRHVKHELKIKYYLRYGDDFLIFNKNREELEKIKQKCINFLQNELRLAINKQNNIIIPVRRGIRFLGVEMWTNGKRLNRRNRRKIQENLEYNNISSYYGIIKQYSKYKKIEEFNWRLLEILS